MANETVKITGKFLDIGGKPLQGTVTIKPAPLYIADADTESIYAGQTKGTLDKDGNLEMHVVSFPGRRYRIDFSITTQGGAKADFPYRIVEIPNEETVANLLASTYEAGSGEPVFEFMQGEPGEILVTGAEKDPSDPGAILITLPA